MGKKGLRCLLLVLVAFGASYVVLMTAFRAGTAATAAAGLGFLILGIGLLVPSLGWPDSRKANYFAMLSGLFLWAAIGEAAHKLGFADLAAREMLPPLVCFVLLLAVVALRTHLPGALVFSAGHFAAIWVLHFVMIYEFEVLGGESWVTRATCPLCALIAVASAFAMTKTKTDTRNMAWSLMLLLFSWTVLEYAWAWRLLPGPWMLAH